MLVIENFLKETKHKGIGVFAGENVKKGETVYVDEKILSKIFPAKEIANLPKVAQDFITNNSDYDEKNDTGYFDCDNARFINHSENPNIWYYPKKKSMVALRDISKGEEILGDYRNFCDECKNRSEMYFKVYENIEKF